jgi:hypothetical protein
VALAGLPVVRAAIFAFGRFTVVLIAGIAGGVALADGLGGPAPLLAAALRGGVAGATGRHRGEALALAGSVEGCLFALAWWTGAPGSLGQGVAILATSAAAAAVFSLTKGRTDVKSGALQAQVFPEPATDQTVNEDKDED